MIKLPTGIVEAEAVNPAKLVMVSHQGVGKTTALAGLPNCLLIDLENGSNTISAMKLNIPKEAKRLNIPEGAALFQTVAAIKAANEAKGDFVYDFIAIDTLTALERLAKDKALNMFSSSVIGKGMARKGEVIKDVVTELAEGSGYMWLFRGFDEIYDWFQGLARYCVIFCGHTKQSSLLKDGQKVEARDIHLTGKLKTDLLRDVDASSYCYRTADEPNKLVMSFKVNEKDLTTKTRSPYLRGKDLILTELNPDTEMLTCNWHLVFPGWVKSQTTVNVKSKLIK